MAASFLGKLSVFDAYTKAKDEGIQVKTLCGAIVTIVSAVLMVTLVLSEASLYMTTHMEHHLVVDQTRSEALHIDVDIVFYAMPCAELDVHIGDTRGHTYAEAKADITKKPFVPPVLMREQPGREWTNDDAPGCIVQGVLSIRKMAGIVAFRPNPGRFGRGGGVVPMQAAALGGTGGAGSHRNFSHQIRQLNMGPLFPGAVNPLDGVKKGFEEAGKPLAQYQYFLKIVPTVYEARYSRAIDTNQYSVTEFVSEIDPKSYEGPMPELLFKVDFSPVMVRLREASRSFLNFLTGLCAILGGVFTVAGMVDSTVYQSTKAIMGKTL